MKLIYHMPLLRWRGNVTGSCLCSVSVTRVVTETARPVSFRFLRAVNESRPIKFLFDAGCRGVITSARYAISDASLLYRGSLYCTVDTRATIATSRPRRASRCLTSSFVSRRRRRRDAAKILPNRSEPSAEFPFFPASVASQVLICQKINLSPVPGIPRWFLEWIIPRRVYRRIEETLYSSP